MSTHADVVVPTVDLATDIASLESLGFVLRVIFPADEPRVAQLSGHGVGIRLDTTAQGGAPTVRLPSAAMEAAGSAEVHTSSGARFVSYESDFVNAPLDDGYVFASGGEWGLGRAGMEYRDLIPARHGGRVIASHIRIAEPGPVPDYVHHHDVRFQMIYCRRGRVEVIYEDQGDAFWMEAGDCVLQPPHIRHRVLASDGGCEVVEIASPAEHPTFVEHEITLPTGERRPDRDFGGQRFSFDRAGDLEWRSAADGWEAQTNGITTATDGLANVRVLRPNRDAVGQPVPATAGLSGTADGDLCLLFVLGGTAMITSADRHQPVGVDDSIAVKSGDAWTIDDASADFECLHVVLSSAEDLETQ